MPENQSYHFASPSELHLWLLPITEVAVESFPEYYRRLSPDERARNQRYVFEKDRIRDLLTRIFIRTLLANYLSVESASLQFEANAYGRPILVWPDNEPTLDFNLSHAGELIACAIVSNGRIGIDIEPVDREVNIQQASHFFSKIELEELYLLPPEQQKEHFLRLWTLKEAYIKAQGQGLSIPLDSFAFYSFREGRMQFWNRHANGNSIDRWSFFSMRTVLGGRLAGAWRHAVPIEEEFNIRLRKFLPTDLPTCENIPFDIDYQIDLKY